MASPGSSPRWGGSFKDHSHLHTTNSRTGSRSPRRFRDSPDDIREEDEEDRLDREFDPMFPKSEIPMSPRVAPPNTRRWRFIGSLSGLVVLIVMALFVALHTNQPADSDMPPAPPRPTPSHDTQVSGLAPADWHPLPTGPTRQVDFAPAPTETPKVRKGIVLATYKGRKVDWLQNLAKYTKGWEIFRYVNDDPNTEFLRVPSEYGREAMVYLTFIIEHYDNLPDYVVFTHGHDRAWHQPEHIIDKLMALNLSAVAKEGYVNMRCSKSPGCTADTKFRFKPLNKDDHRPGMLIKDGFWQNQMQQEFGDLPALMGRRCCAQFAVTRNAIRLRSLAFWKSLRKPLLGKMDNIKKLWGQDIDKYKLGSMYEQVWHVLFGKHPDFCPEKEYCQKIHFSDAIHCDGETTSFKSSQWNWFKISCKNKLREAINAGLPVDAILSDPPLPNDQGFQTGDDILPSEEKELKKELESSKTKAENKKDPGVN